MKILNGIEDNITLDNNTRGIFETVKQCFGEREAFIRKQLEKANQRKEEREKKKEADMNNNNHNINNNNNI